jgi:hypothetical protein
LQTESIFSDILESGVASGVFTFNDPLLVAAAIKALLQDWYLKRWKYRRRMISVEGYADFVISMISAYGVGKYEGNEQCSHLIRPKRSGRENRWTSKRFWII